MRDINRIDKILDRLKVVWEENPDLRLGQLILNVVRDPTLYYVEDEALLDALEYNYLKQVNEKEDKGYFVSNTENKLIYHYKGYDIELLNDDYGQQFYFIFDGKEYGCGSFNTSPEYEVEAVIDYYLKNKESL